MIIGHFVHRRRWLSNFHYCHVEYTTYSGKRTTYRSVEHGYQAQKATSPEDHDWIAAANGAAEARRRGRSIKGIRHNWYGGVGKRIMLKLLWSKFYHNPHLRKLLIATWPHELMHGNTHNDRYWGIDRRTGEGEDHLGKLLMFLREQIREGRDHLIPKMGHKKLKYHKKYRARHAARLEEANLGTVVRPLPAMTREVKDRLYGKHKRRR